MIVSRSFFFLAEVFDSLLSTVTVVFDEDPGGGNISMALAVFPVRDVWVPIREEVVTQRKLPWS